MFPNQDMVYPDEVLLDIRRTLTMSEFTVLGKLYEEIEAKKSQGDFPACLPTEIAQQLRMNGSSIRAVVSKLEGAGIIKTSPGFSDARTRVIELRQNAYRLRDLMNEEGITNV
ncbi:helix-turn-helix domain-containing protein [Alicyclobacillus mengziensis]|uniref:Uncharacterized protein n=1 Tax=Alicyclobacillus mengziensis TaxID=2931921 RepID=A0A9X7W476_9BACL|nr:hypothetical protein [Alicyclobacillus mengziensis]QSO50114.1 hypothetical protein JZ786_24675 [Alicyclobacillus mengziensis]